METYQAPTKEQVRQYLRRRFGSEGPVPSPGEIRRAIGWVACAQEDATLVAGKEDVSTRESNAA